MDAEGFSQSRKRERERIYTKIERTVSLSQKDVHYTVCVSKDERPFRMPDSVANRNGQCPIEKDVGLGEATAKSFKC